MSPIGHTWKDLKLKLVVYEQRAKGFMGYGQGSKLSEKYLIEGIVVSI
jgi:hypothetical protein